MVGDIARRRYQSCFADYPEARIDGADLFGEMLLQIAGDTNIDFIRRFLLLHCV